MSQTRTVSFEQPLTSLEENHRILGIQTPGIICGWDGFTPSGTTLSMFHTTTGLLKTNLVPTTQQGPNGIICSRQGTQIEEDADVPVVVATNDANAYDRIDILIMQHQHVEATGGTAATYSVVQGSNGGPVEPAIPNDKIQVLVGKFYIKASATDHLQTDWIREPIRIGDVAPYTMEPDGKTWIANNYENRDFDNVINAGIYSINSTTNRPTTGTPYWHLTVGTRALRIVQMATSMDNGKSFSRVSVDGGTTWLSWQNLNNTDVAGFNPDDITDAIGATSLAALDYSSNNYVTDATSLEAAVGALDARAKINADAIGNNATNISNNLAAVGNLNYSSNYIVADSDSATTAIGKIDAAIGDRLYVNEYVITDGDIISISLDDIDSAIGSRLYSAETAVVDGQSISASIEALDLAIGATVLKRKIVEIGVWDMDLTDSVNIAHGVDPQKIRFVEAAISQDQQTTTGVYSLVKGNALGEVEGWIQWARTGASSTDISLNRVIGGIFDSTLFNDTGAPNENRGWITIWYE